MNLPAAARAALGSVRWQAVSTAPPTARTTTPRPTSNTSVQTTRNPSSVFPLNSYTYPPEFFVRAQALTRTGRRARETAPLRRSCAYASCCTTGQTSPRLLGADSDERSLMFAVHVMV